MMRPSRRSLLLGALATAAHRSAIAQTKGAGTSAKGKKARLALVLPGVEGLQEAAFRNYLLDLGLDASFKVYSSGDDPARLPDIVARLKADPPDLIYTTGTPTTLGVAGRYDAPNDGRHVTDIPIVFTSVADPVGAGIIPSLDKPGRNVTGSSHVAPIERQVDTILAYRRVKTIGTLYDPAELNAELTVEKLRGALEAKGVRLLAAAVPLDSAGLPLAAPVTGQIAGLARDGAEFLYIGPDTFVASRVGAMVTQAAIDNRLPSFSAVEVSFALTPGALVGLVSPRSEQGVAAGYKAEKILLLGRKAENLPSDPLVHFALLININVARALDLYPPMDLIPIAEFVTP